MKEKIKELRLNATVSAVLSVIIGVLLLVFPEASIFTIGKILAIIVIVAGVAVIISQIVEFGMNVMGIVVGVVVTLVGIYMFAKPAAIMTLIPIIMGVLIVVHGIQDLGMAIEGSKAKADRAWVPYVIAVINIILGLICIAYAFGFVSLAFRIVGLMLIFDGVTDLGIIHKVKSVTKEVVDTTISSEEDIL